MPQWICPDCYKALPAKQVARHRALHADAKRIAEGPIEVLLDAEPNHLLKELRMRRNRKPRDPHGEEVVKVEDMSYVGVDEVLADDARRRAEGPKGTPAERAERKQAKRAAQGPVNSLDANRAYSTVEKPVAVVWRLCDELHNKPRGEVIAACVAAGVNVATARTQYQKWSKARKAAAVTRKLG